ncbi:E3 ubiquitin-protein ligase MARCHF3 [Anabrus simplex]|uniref:E3 ubiquitin-protein ligase MARCHF3 n=1 Tax=Anabrus simplex TaxID=316456 RepID=UPI0035A34F71
MGSESFGKYDFTSQSTTNSSPVGEKIENPSIHSSQVVMVLKPQNSSGFSQRQAKGSLASSSAVCRICHEDDLKESLISPCNCTGTLGLIHRRCLEKWLSTSNTDRCEICKFRFLIDRLPKSVWQWLNSGGLLGPKGFLGDFICLLVLLPLSLISVYLCGFGAHKYIQHHEWEGTGLAMLCFFLLLAFILWCCVTVRFHYKMFQEWRRKNQVIRLVMTKNNRSDIAIEVNNNSHSEEAQNVRPATLHEDQELNIFDPGESSTSNQGETCL